MTDSAAIEALKAALRGRVIEPEDADYDARARSTTR